MITNENGIAILSHSLSLLFLDISALFLLKKDESLLSGERIGMKFPFNSCKQGHLVMRPKILSLGSSWAEVVPDLEVVHLDQTLVDIFLI